MVGEIEVQLSQMHEQKPWHCRYQCPLATTFQTNAVVSSLTKITSIATAIKADPSASTANYMTPFGAIAEDIRRAKYVSTTRLLRTGGGTRNGRCGRWDTTPSIGGRPSRSRNCVLWWRFCCRP